MSGSGTAVAIADTGALLAYYKGDEADHEACRKALATVGHLVVPPMVLAELDYLVTSHLGAKTAMSVLGHIADKVAIGRYEIPEVGAHLHAARAVMQSYVDLAIGLTDAMNVVLARDFRTMPCSRSTAGTSARYIRSPRTVRSRLLPDDMQT